MRHAPFAVTPAMRDRWLKHMRDAIEEIDLTPQQLRELWSYLERAAYSMVNTFERIDCSPLPWGRRRIYDAVSESSLIEDEVLAVGAALCPHRRPRARRTAGTRQPAGLEGASEIWPRPSARVPRWG